VLCLKNNLIFYTIKIVVETLYAVFYSEFPKDFDENSLVFQELERYPEEIIS